MKKVDLLKEDILKLIIRYMIPSVTGMLGLSLCIFLDTMFIGQGIGNDGLAALNIGIPIYNLFNSIGLICGVGGATVLAISIGKKRYDELDEIFTVSISIAFIIGVLITVIGSIFLNQISIILGASDTLLPLVMDYLKVILGGSIAFIMASILNVFVRNDGDPKKSMWAIIGVNITNIVLDYIFIFPLNMGMKGAAIATTIGQIVGIAILLSHFFTGRNGIKFNMKSLSTKYVKRILSNGFPSFILEISAGIVIFMFNVKLAKISGDLAVSAYSIIANVALIFVAIFNGISQGIQPILGVNYGADKLKRVFKTYKLGIRIALISGIVFLSIGLFMPKVLISIFSSNTEGLLEIATKGIRIYFLAFIPMGINIVNIGFLQSIEKSKLSTWLSLIRGFVLIIIVLNIFSIIFGVDGVWMTIPIVESITIILSGIIVKKIEGRIGIVHK